MQDMSYPYLQPSGNQFVETLKILVDAYTNVALIIAALLLVLLVWLCVAELRQSQKRARMGRLPQPRSPRPSSVRRPRDRQLLEESLF